jgi:GNAT superfamily N-acetyltransferase
MQVEGMFDVPQVRASSVEWELPDELVQLSAQSFEANDIADPGYVRSAWNVGLIVGPSGSGKTTVARALWPDAFGAELDWPEDRSVLDAFDPSMSVKDVVGLLNAVGFGSPPSWLRPFHVLSTGEQFRATLARLLATDADPDRHGRVHVAGLIGGSLRSARTRSRRPCAAPASASSPSRPTKTCCLAATRLGLPAGLQRLRVEASSTPPRARFDVAGCERDVWRALSPSSLSERRPARRGSLLRAVDYEDEPVAFCAVYKFPHPKVKNIMTIHRIVVLPDWQGIGLGGGSASQSARRQKAYGYRTRITLAHPTLIRSMAASDLWKLDGRANAPSRSAKPKRLVKQHANPRKLATQAGVRPGAPSSTSDHEGNLALAAVGIARRPRRQADRDAALAGPEVETRSWHGAEVGVSSGSASPSMPRS